jgi:branched-chain amino acid transport system substrate-binding protein
MQHTRRKLLAGASALLAATALAAPGAVLAQGQPIKVGIGIAQTGPLGGGGKAALLGLQMWVDDVNAKGGLLGRKVQLIAYDDQSNPAVTPGIYTKLLDVDKVDLLVAPYGTNPTAPIMPLVKQRDLLLMGNFSFDANAKIQHDKWFNNAPWGAGAVAWGGTFLEAGKALGGKTIAFLAADAEFAQNLATGARAISKAMGLQTVYDQNYPPNTVDFSSMIRAVRNAKPDIVFVASYPGESAALVRAVNEIGVGSSVKLIGGGMVGLQFTPIMEPLGSMLNGFVNFHSWVPEKTMDFPGVADFLKRYQARGAGEGRSPGLLPAAVQLRHRADARAGGDGDQEPGPQDAGRLHPQERDEDHRRQHPLRRRGRVGDAAPADDPVPGRDRQERGPVPRPGPAGDHRAGEAADGQRSALRQAAQVASTTAGTASGRASSGRSG